jgi:hypothetical protein
MNTSKLIIARKMKPSKIAFVMILISFIFLAMAFLTGCETLGISLQTDYGMFTYELPQPKGTKK